MPIGGRPIICLSDRFVQLDVPEVERQADDAEPHADQRVAEARQAARDAVAAPGERQPEGDTTEHEHRGPKRPVV